MTTAWTNSLPDGANTPAPSGFILHSSFCIWFYSTAGFLVKVETYTTDWQPFDRLRTAPQAEMTYDGLGNTSTGSVTAAWK